MLKRIGKYKINGLIARGTSSNVYLAQDPNLLIQVAIKVFDGRLTENQQGQTLKQTQKQQNAQIDFMSESKILHRLSSAPHIVPFMEFDFTEAKQAYIVMPYYKRTLADLLGMQNKLSVHKTLLIAQQILTGLGYIHEAGLFHLDIKPANILLDDSDQVQIADFGISIANEPLKAAKASNRNVGKMGKGSQHYASPEQVVDTQNVTAQSDIYALCALMYRCISGAHFSDLQQPLAMVDPRVDNELSEIIQRGLSANPEQRPKSAQQMALTIAHILSKCEARIRGLTPNDDPEATRIWTANSEVSNNTKQLRQRFIESLKETLLTEGEISRFHFTRLALLAKAELHEQYTDEWLYQYIEQIRSQLARDSSKVAALFLWIQHIDEAINAAIRASDSPSPSPSPKPTSHQGGFPQYKGSLSEEAKQNLIALGNTTLDMPSQAILDIMKRKLDMANIGDTQHSSARKHRQKSQGRFISAVFIVVCALLIPWWLQSDKLELDPDRAGLSTIEQATVGPAFTRYVDSAANKSANSANDIIIDIADIHIENSSGISAVSGVVQINLQIHPADAEVVMQSMQGMPVSNENLKQGDYWLRVSKNGYQTLVKKITIASNQYIINERLTLSDTRYFIGNTDKTVADGIPLEFILLPNTAKAAINKTTNQLTGRIRMMSFEVSNQLYAACVDAGQCGTSKKVSTDYRYRTFSLPQHPVINVSWFDITEQFIPWLSEQTGTSLRLPTKSEWEFAAAGSIKNSANLYSWGATMQGDKAHCKNCNGSGRNYADTTMPVRSFAPNNWQLFDMHGNVQEWTSTCPKPSASMLARSRLEPRCDLAVVKGGSWLSDKRELAISTDDFLRKTVRSHTTGFRLVEEVNE